MNCSVWLLCGASRKAASVSAWMTAWSSRVSERIVQFKDNTFDEVMDM
jgi:hypothetical protein